MIGVLASGSLITPVKARLLSIAENLTRLDLVILDICPSAYRAGRGPSIC